MNNFLNWVDAQGAGILLLLGLLLVTLLLLKPWVKKSKPKRKFKNGGGAGVISPNTNTNTMVTDYKNDLYETSSGVDVPEQDLERLN
jgi:hypothetical protein